MLGYIDGYAYFCSVVVEIAVALLWKPVARAVN
jgi:hypothetical protein